MITLGELSKYENERHYGQVYLTSEGGVIKITMDGRKLLDDSVICEDNS